MANPNDVIRDAILRYLYETHKRARSPKSAGIGIRDLARSLKSQGFKQQEVASNLDYLVQKGWVREVIERRAFTTPMGTTRQVEKRSYKISDVGIDRLEAASTYQRPPAASHLNITNIHGVTVVGDGNVVNTALTDLFRGLESLRRAILEAPTLGDREKLDITADIDSLQSQLQKPSPAKALVKSLWEAVEKAVTAAGLAELLGKVRALIGPLIG